MEDPELVLIVAVVFVVVVDGLIVKDDYVGLIELTLVCPCAVVPEDWTGVVDDDEDVKVELEVDPVVDVDVEVGATLIGSYELKTLVPDAVVDITSLLILAVWVSVIGAVV